MHPGSQTVTTQNSQPVNQTDRQTQTKLYALVKLLMNLKYSDKESSHALSKSTKKSIWLRKLFRKNANYDFHMLARTELIRYCHHCARNSMYHNYVTCQHIVVSVSYTITMNNHEHDSTSDDRSTNGSETCSVSDCRITLQVQHRTIIYG